MTADGEGVDSIVEVTVIRLVKAAVIEGGEELKVAVVAGEKPLARAMPRVLNVPRLKRFALVEQQPLPLLPARQQYVEFEHWATYAPPPGSSLAIHIVNKGSYA